MSAREVSASPDAGSAIPDPSTTFKSLITVGSQATNKGEPVKGNDPMVISTGEVDKVASSSAFSLKRKKEEILNLAQSSLEKQTHSKGSDPRDGGREAGESPGPNFGPGCKN